MMAKILRLRKSYTWLIIGLAETTNNTTGWDFTGIKITMDFVQTLFIVLLPWIFVMIILKAFFSFFEGRR